MNAAGMRRWLALGTLMLGMAPLGCRGTEGAVASALINTGIAMSAAAIQRASGGCYSTCPVGTACDEESGYCMPLPCRGRCRSDERCVGNGVSEQCEALALPEGGLDVRPAPPPAASSDAPRKEPEPSP